MVLLYPLFVLAVAIAAYLVLRTRSRREQTGEQVIICPEIGTPASVEVDRNHALVTLLDGIKEVRLQSCSRWPERQECDQDCLMQIAPEKHVDEVLARWYDGQNCASCNMPLVSRDWKMGKAAGVDRQGALIELREMDWAKFPRLLEQYRPLCWKCHSATLTNRREAHAASASA